jgi:hypothetical protein
MKRIPEDDPRYLDAAAEAAREAARELKMRAIFAKKRSEETIARVDASQKQFEREQLLRDHRDRRKKNVIAKSREILRRS